MITYVNTVLVANQPAALVADPKNLAQPTDVESPEAGHFIIMNLDPNTTEENQYTIDANTQKIKIGLVTNKNVVVRTKNGNKITVKYQPIIKWTNDIKKHDIKSFTELIAPATMNDADSEDKVTIDFTSLNGTILDKLAEGGKRVIVRLTFKDLPTRYRKWTESYEYVTMVGDTKQNIIEGIASQING